MNNLLQLKEVTKDLSVLYVEDEKLIRDTVVKYLSKIFQKVDFAINGQEGLEKFKQRGYDLVISDINMPVMNGQEMLKEIKRININQKVLLVSAYVDEKYLQEYKTLDINDYLFKPIEYDKLNATLYRICI